MQISVTMSPEKDKEGSVTNHLDENNLLTSTQDFLYTTPVQMSGLLYFAVH